MVTNTVAALKELVEAERLGAAVTVVSGPDVGAKVIVAADEGYMVGELPADIAGDVLADAGELMHNEQSKTLGYGDREVYIETVAPPPHLLVFGAGHVSQPLSRMAHELGFRVTVCDARKTFATRDRFPDVDELIAEWPDVALEKVAIDTRTYVVLLSHDPRFEDPVFPAVLRGPARYIGAMGSRKTHRDRIARLTEAGFTEQEVSRIHGPVGLDIGAETPAEMAIAILGEMTQVRYGAGSGLSLRGQPGRIHSQRGGEPGTD